MAQRHVDAEEVAARSDKAEAEWGVVKCRLEPWFDGPLRHTDHPHVSAGTPSDLSEDHAASV
jgi:hypothetical protein